MAYAVSAPFVINIMEKENIMKLFKVKDWLKDVRYRALSESDNPAEEPPAQNRLQQRFGIVSQWLKSHVASIAVTMGIAGISTMITIGGMQYIEANTLNIYHVLVDGEEVGTVSDPAVVKSMLTEKRREIQEQYPHAHMNVQVGTITYEAESAYKPIVDEAGTLTRIQGLITAHATGVELKVDGKTIGIVKDLQTADDIMRKVKQQYIPEEPKKSPAEVSVLSFGSADASITALSAKPEEDEPEMTLESATIVENVQKLPISTDPNQIIDPDEVLRVLRQSDMKPTTYIVQPGDCVSCIAQKFGISKQLIYQKNDWIENDMIRVGEELDLTVEQPLVTVETVERLVEHEQIQYPVIYEKDETLPKGKTQVIKKGKNGSKRVTYRLTKQNGLMMREDLIDEEVLVEPVPEVMKKGTKVMGEGSGRFAWPVFGAKLTSSYGKRWGKMHKGIDLVSNNKNILAADDGRIEFVGVKSGYGNCIIINHQNGYKTLYGHLSKTGVKKGAYVEKGAKIGVMGNTGNSFGVHLHFEIYKNNAVQNPMKYLSRK